MIRQQWNVFAALAQVGHADGNHTEAIVEILAELIFGYRLIQIAVGGGDNPHIDGNLTGAADRANRALLQHTQQFHLHGQRHLTDFVQEDGAAACDFKQAALVLIGSGKSALQVSEEFAFQQSLGKGAAVHGYERLGGARRTNVNGAGYQFLTGTALTVNQNGAGGGSDGTHRLL